MKLTRDSFEPSSILLHCISEDVFSFSFMYEFESICVGAVGVL